MIFHRERLVAALNKYWRPLTEEEYLHKMDRKMTTNAVMVSQFPEEVNKWVWEPEKKPTGLVWTS